MSLFKKFFVKLDPDLDPRFLSSWIRIRIQENCWILIRKKWKRIHSPYYYCRHPQGFSYVINYGNF